MTNYEETKVAYETAIQKWGDIRQREKDARTKLDEMKSEVRVLENERKALFAAAASAEPTSESIRAQRVNKERLAAAQSELMDAEDAHAAFAGPLATAEDIVRDAHTDLKNTIHALQRAEYQIVCDELVEVAAPLIAKALSFPGVSPTNTFMGMGFSRSAVEELMRKTKLDKVEPDPTAYQCPALPYGIKDRWSPQRTMSVVERIRELSPWERQAVEGRKDSSDAEATRLLAQEQEKRMEKAREAGLHNYTNRANGIGSVVG